MFRNHKLIEIDGVPLIIREDLVLPYQHLNDFPNCCGPGEGLWNMLVMDTFWMLRMSAACCLHDDDYANAEPTKEAFDACNARFMYNMESIINCRTKFWILKRLRMRKAKIYLYAVKSKQAFKRCFWSLKIKQKYEGLWEGFELPSMKQTFWGG